MGLQPINPCLKFTKSLLQISEKEFSLTANYHLIFTWHDERITVRNTSSSGTWMKVLDNSMLKHIWIPLVRDEGFSQTYWLHFYNVS